MPPVKSLSLGKGQLLNSDDRANHHDFNDDGDDLEGISSHRDDEDDDEGYNQEHPHSHPNDDEEENKNEASTMVPSSPTRETTGTTASDFDDELDLDDSFDEYDVEEAGGDDDQRRGGGRRRGRGRNVHSASSSSVSWQLSDSFQPNDNPESATFGNVDVILNPSAVGVTSSAVTNASSTVTKRSGVDLYVEALHPPPSRFERSRDALLRFLDTPVVQFVGVLVLLLVIIDGAIFFFFLMGWQTLCHEPSRTDCEPRNRIYNASIQILTVLFTIMTIISLPWRMTQASHAFGVLQFPKRRNDVGHDIYGVVSHDVWYHIPLRHRRCIVTMLLINCATQYLNQAARIIFNTYEDQSTFPGTLFVNVFFATSFVAAFVGGVHMAIVSEHVRRQHPERFGPGPLQIFLASSIGQRLCRYFGGCRACCCCCCYCGCCDLQVAKIEVEAQEREIQDAIQHDSALPFDPTSSEIRIAHPLARRGSRTELRMFAM